MLKFKIGGVREEVENLIKKAAKHLQFYDPRFPEKSQAAGYYAFKEMCLMKEDICSLTEFNEYNDMVDINVLFSDKKCPNGFYLLTRIHPNARKITIDTVNMVRKIFSESNTDKVEIVNKYR
jgi:hypothetical protein